MRKSKKMSDRQKTYILMVIPALLLFVAFKMLLSDFYHISVGTSLAVILGVLAATILFSYLFRNKTSKEIA